MCHVVQVHDVTICSLQPSPPQLMSFDLVLFGGTGDLDGGEVEEAAASADQAGQAKDGPTLTTELVRW